MIDFLNEDSDAGRELALEADCTECQQEGHCLHCIDYDELPTLPGISLQMQCCVCGCQCTIVTRE